MGDLLEAIRTALEKDLLMHARLSIGFQGGLGGKGSRAQCGHCGAALKETQEGGSKLESHCHACGNRATSSQFSDSGRELVNLAFYHQRHTLYRELGRRRYFAFLKRFFKHLGLKSRQQRHALGRLKAIIADEKWQYES